MRDKLFYFLFFIFLQSGFLKIYADCPESYFSITKSDTIGFAEKDTFRINLCPVNISDSIDFYIKWPDFSLFVNDETIEIDSLFVNSEYFREYSIQFFDFGFKKIDSIPLVFSLGDNNQKYIDTIIYLNLDFYISEPNLSGDFKNKKSIQSVPFLFSELWKDSYYRNILLLILFFTLLFSIIFYFKNHILSMFSNVKINSEEELVLELVFLKKLKEIETQKEVYFEKEKYKEFYTILSEFLREYFEKKYNILALESTTIDLINILKRKKIFEKWMVEFLEVSDLVKFAKYNPKKIDHNLFFISLREYFLKNLKKIKND